MSKSTIKFFVDARGLGLSTVSEKAARAYRKGVDLMLSAWPGALEFFMQAIKFDPEFGLAYAAVARQCAIQSKLDVARDFIVKAEDLVNATRSERERSHVYTLSLAIHGNSKAALQSALAHIDKWPLDVVVMGLPLGAFGLFAFSGRNDHDQARVDLCERYFAKFSEADWWFNCYRGWSHTENGDVEQGRRFTERSLELRWRNANGAHAFAHLLHEVGEAEEGERFISEWLRGYGKEGVLHGHIAWHAALAALEQGDSERAIEYYVGHVAAPVSLGTPLNIISDSASFLWRLRSFGYGVPESLISDAAQYSSNYFPGAGFAFADVHMAMLDAVTGSRVAVKQRLDQLHEILGNGESPTGEVSLALCKALQAFVDDDHKECVTLLERVAKDIARIGGSGAQRQVFEDTLLISLIKSGRLDQARRLLSDRMHRRQTSREVQLFHKIPML